MNSTELWDYARELYARNGVAGALLGLQNRRGADINLLLWCCWCAHDGRGALDADSLRAADAAIAEWRESVTRPLRAARDAIGKDGPLAALEGAAELRRGVLDVEIHAERIALGVLEDRAPARRGHGDARALAAASLGRCCRLFGFEPDQDDKQALLTVLAGAFDTTLDAALRAVLEEALARR